MKLLALFLYSLLLFSSGCDFRKRENELQQKEASVRQKEQELSLKEKTLQLKEQELIKRELRLDSTLKTDTTNLYNPALVGIWSVKMVCTETTCSGSAIGDTKSEQWNIFYQAGHIIAKAMVGGKLVRVYTGLFTGNTIELSEEQDSTLVQPSTKMIVHLRFINETSMEGQREIARGNDCKIVYALELEKQ